MLRCNVHRVIEIASLTVLNLPRETVPEGNGMFLVRDAMTTARKRSWGTPKSAIPRIADEIEYPLCSRSVFAAL